jgi:hydroxymethylglutaryl-CoA lyase
VSATDGHSKANVGKTVAQAIEESNKLVRAAKEDGIFVRGYVSMAFGCPIDGTITTSVLVS